MKLVQFVLPSGGSSLLRSGNLSGIVIRASRCAAVGLFCLLLAFQAWSDDCAAPPAGLVAWWPGEGTANDIVGTNNGTVVGGVTFTNGEVGQAFSLNGSSGYIRVPDSALWAFATNNFTIEMWANFKAVPPGSLLYPYGGFLIGKDEGTGTKNKWWFALAGGVLAFHINNPSVGPYVFLVQAPFTPSLQQWYHLAVVGSGDTVTIFTNGVPIGSAINTVPVPNVNAPLTIGQAEGFYFNGRLDEVSIYGRALSDEEIAAIYNAGSAGKCQPPIITSQPRNQVGYWGKSVTFTVTATGSAPLSYQWLKDANPLAGASGSALPLTNLQATNAGNYSVIVSNSVGSTISSNAYLTVNPAGVSLALYAGITIDGVVGLTYGIQYSTNLSNTTGWRGMANVTLSVTPQLWFDLQPVTQPQRYYRVVPGPITIP